MSREVVERLLMSGVHPDDINTVYEMGRTDMAINCHQHGLNYADECPHCAVVNDLVMASEVMQKAALDVQVGGDHYKKKAIQPVQYCMANGIGFMEGCVIKYVSRWRDKGGIQDLEKARHFLDMLIEYEKGKGA